MSLFLLSKKLQFGPKERQCIQRSVHFNPRQVHFFIFSFIAGLFLSMAIRPISQPLLFVQESYSFFICVMLFYNARQHEECKALQC